VAGSEIEIGFADYPPFIRQQLAIFTSGSAEVLDVAKPSLWSGTDCLRQWLRRKVKSLPLPKLDLKMIL
jgi:hypothetical protein